MAIKKVLAIDDHKPTLALYKSLFEAEKERFALKTADNGEKALTLLKKEPFDVVILDWLLPGISGPEVLSEIRSNPSTKFTLVFVVTGIPDTDNWVHTLDCGADDYLTKPFSLTLLKAKLHSLLRRREMAMAEFEVFEAGGVKLSPASDYVEVEGRLVRLFIKEIEILKVFLKRPNMIVKPEYLWDAVWGYHSPSWKHTLEATISSLRAKLGEKHEKHLETHRGKGYLFSTHYND